MCMCVGGGREAVLHIRKEEEGRAKIVDPGPRDVFTDERRYRLDPTCVKFYLMTKYTIGTIYHTTRARARARVVYFQLYINN